MRLEPLVSRPVRAATILLAALLVVGSLSCAKGGGKRTFTLEVTTLAKANSCGQETGNSLSFRIVQVTDATPIAGVPLANVWDREERVFGAAFVAKKDGYVDPGLPKKARFQYELDPKAKAVVFVGSFCKPEGECWYVTRSLDKGRTLRLTIDEFCARERK
jgi:type VI secretion system VasD/TssJ family lipoprotein